MYTDINRCAGAVLHGFQPHDVIKMGVRQENSLDFQSLLIEFVTNSVPQIGGIESNRLLAAFYMQILKIILDHTDHKTIDLDDCLRFCHIYLLPK